MFCSSQNQSDKQELPRRDKCDSIWFQFNMLVIVPDCCGRVGWAYYFECEWEIIVCRILLHRCCL